MQAQARTQGRHLGGRPPYGYRLVDAGPHPNRVHAGWGRRLHRLDPDPHTAAHLQHIFALRLAGHSIAGIARTLNALGIDVPAAHDRTRNPHRSGTAWTMRTVAAILANPRYTGRQVWNRQGIDHHENTPGSNPSRHHGHGPTHGWNPTDEWVISTDIAHPPLVSEADWIRAQQITAIATPGDDSARRYRLTGLVICGLCGRRAEGHWAHHRAWYRCRHAYTSSSPATPDRPRTLYLREDCLLQATQAQLTGTCSPSSTALDDIAAWLSDRGHTIVCTHASITLDHGNETPTRYLERASTGTPATEWAIPRQRHSQARHHGPALS